MHCDPRLKQEKSRGQVGGSLRDRRGHKNVETGFSDEWARYVENTWSSATEAHSSWMEYVKDEVDADHPWLKISEQVETSVIPCNLCIKTSGKRGRKAGRNKCPCWELLFKKKRKDNLEQH